MLNEANVTPKEKTGPPASLPPFCICLITIHKQKSIQKWERSANGSVSDISVLKGSKQCPTQCFLAPILV